MRSVFYTLRLFNFFYSPNVINYANSCIIHNPFINSICRIILVTIWRMRQAALINNRLTSLVFFAGILSRLRLHFLPLMASHDIFHIFQQLSDDTCFSLSRTSLPRASKASEAGHVHTQRCRSPAFQKACKAHLHRTGFPPGRPKKQDFLLHGLES